ncbi:MAG TPA: 23S rRNA pseudouridine(1911/1915/1917) synthase RluD [Steroidobacteraceae bacterium]|nr:23S rRNA pseudouridine(1911/1915/1917) synthase RluD [Steroidobacteraceae bacterium]
MTVEFRTHEIGIPADLAGMRLDQALARLLPQYSRQRLQRWIEAGEVQVNGAVPRARDKVLGGEQVRIRAQLPAATTVGAESLPVTVVYEDEALRVIDKPAGLVVHPGAGNPTRTLQNALLGLDPALARVPRAGLIHRLDKDTSGLMVVARTLEAHTALVAQLAAREIERRYVAVCVGVLTGGRTVDEPIGRHRSARTKMAVRSDGRPAVTHLRIIERFRAHTEVLAQLETGRTHQIRVHLAHVGHPVVGDPVYGSRKRYPPGASEALRSALDGFGRQALHAAELGLEHPFTGEMLSWTAPLPADMRALLAALAADQRAHAAAAAASHAHVRARR